MRSEQQPCVHLIHVWEARDNIDRNVDGPNGDALLLLWRRSPASSIRRGVLACKAPAQGWIIHRGTKPEGWTRSLQTDDAQTCVRRRLRRGGISRSLHQVQGVSILNACGSGGMLGRS